MQMFFGNVSIMRKGRKSCILYPMVDLQLSRLLTGGSSTPYKNGALPKPLPPPRPRNFYGVLSCSGRFDDIL